MREESGLDAGRLTSEKAVAYQAFAAGCTTATATPTPPRGVVGVGVAYPRCSFAVLSTHVPLDAQRVLGFACGLHGHMRATVAHAPMKTAMEKEQTRERERYTRTIASGPRQDAEKSSH